MITRPWPSLGFGWVLDVVALILLVLLWCGVAVPHGLMIPVTLMLVAMLVG